MMTNKITILIDGTKVNEILRSLKNLYPDCDWEYDDGAITGYEVFRDEYTHAYKTWNGDPIPSTYDCDREIYVGDLRGRIQRYKYSHKYNDDELFLDDIMIEEIDDE